MSSWMLRACTSKIPETTEALRSQARTTCPRSYTSPLALLGTAGNSKQIPPAAGQPGNQAHRSRLLRHATHGPSSQLSLRPPFRHSRRPQPGSPAAEDPVHPAGGRGLAPCSSPQPQPPEPHGRSPGVWQRAVRHHGRRRPGCSTPAPGSSWPTAAEAGHSARASSHLNGRVDLPSCFGQAGVQVLRLQVREIIKD
jgi:hypothetical protein